MHELRALVVDDSKLGRITMMRKLESMGIRADLAESGGEALEYLARSRPDLIFMDHMMPDMDGFEVTRRIKASSATRDIPVIIVSGNDEASFVEQARQAGALDAIAKPPADALLERLLASLPAPSAGPVAETPPAAPPAPGLTEAQIRPLLEGVERRVRAEFQARLDDILARQEAALAQVREQAGEAALLDGRLRSLERQARELAAEVAEMARAAGAAPHARAPWDELESRFNDRLAEQAGAMAELARRLPDLSALEGRLEELGSRLRALEAMAGRPLPDLDALRAGLEQRIAALEAQALTAAAAEGLGVEVAQLRARLRRLATLTLVGGAVLLGAIGLLLALA